ncbi:fimbria/pilus periplasmic chaperone [Dyella sp. M7H15-1]|uniref:fimbrial biogenesis chaperone n=1 Tax=Dyella sp. M7H15-1 TaxID=2501295 RepID=UPI00197AA860|nr:fimbria/pilus periplasmic chaperone [Dyella sp. M7H15-1]
MIYPAQEREITLSLTNDEKTQPRLVQAWIDDGQVDTPPDQIHVPFELMPPVFRLDAGKSQVLRIVYTHENSAANPLPKDKESLFWLNVLSVPPDPSNAKSQNLLKFAIRTRIKFFLRPEGLAGDAEQAPAQLQWKRVSHGNEQTLEAYNPSAYHISFANIAVVVDGREVKSEPPPMLAPGATGRYVLKDLTQPPTGAATIRFTTVNDYGTAVDHTAKL